MAIEDSLHGSLAAYMQAPNWMRHIAGTVYRSLPAALRYGDRYREFAAEIGASLNSAPWAQVERRLEAALQAAAGAAAHAARAAWLQDRRLPPLERLRQLPLLGKDEIKADLRAHLHLRARPDQLLETFTGGSTAQPMRFYLQRHVSRPRETAYLHRIEHVLLGARLGDWSLSLRGRSVASAANPRGRMLSIEPIKRHLIFSSDHLEPRFMPAYVRELQRLRPRLIHAFPSALYALARWLQRHPAPAFADHVAGILLTSETVYGFQTELLRAVFPRARIVEHYGHSERVLCAVKQHGASHYSFCPLYGLPELVDARGHPIDRPGVLGELVGTGFDNDVMPLLRYRTGDMGMWSSAPRYEGVACFELQRIEGRLQEFVVCRDHRLVSITTLGAAHFDALSRVDAIQFEQRAAGRLLLKVVASSKLLTAERAAITRAIHHKTQGGCEVELLEVETIPRTERGKHRMLIQHLDLSRYLGATIVSSEVDPRVEMPLEAALAH
jgi:phenylacetate-CoA ligase